MTLSPSSSTASTRCRSPNVEAVAERLDRRVGADDAAVRLEEPAVARIGHDAEPVLDLTRVEHLERHAALGQCVAVRPPVAQVERPVQLEQRAAALRLQLAPEREALLGEPDPARLRVREPDDAGTAVARTAVVAELELLADDDVATGAHELPRRREPHHARADDDDLGVDGGHGAEAYRR